jgi:hypothetical protein
MQNQAGVAQLVEHNVANVVVEGSNPFTRSFLLPWLNRTRQTTHAGYGSWRQSATTLPTGFSPFLLLNSACLAFGKIGDVIVTGR